MLRVRCSALPSRGRLHQGLLGSTAAASGLGASDAPALALGDEVPPLLDLTQDAVALDHLAEARDQMFRGFTVSKID
jgi:hypothetical protein